MSARRKIKLYVQDIIISIGKIEKYTKGFKFEEFIKDEKTIDAIVRNLSVIGEAAKNIPEEVKRKYPQIPWREIIGMRNKVMHEYFGVEEQVLWKTIKDDIPVLKVMIKKLK